MGRARKTYRLVPSTLLWGREFFSIPFRIFYVFLEKNKKKKTLPPDNGIGFFSDVAEFPGNIGIKKKTDGSSCIRGRRVMRVCVLRWVVCCVSLNFEAARGLKQQSRRSARSIASLFFPLCVIQKTPRRGVRVLVSSSSLVLAAETTTANETDDETRRARSALSIPRTQHHHTNTHSTHHGLLFPLTDRPCSLSP